MAQAQIQTSRDGHSVFTVTFRCPKPKNGAPALFTEQQVRAAKIRFILLWLPALRGSSAHQYAAYVAEFENVYRSKGHDVGIGRLLEKQRRLMKRKVISTTRTQWTPCACLAFLCVPQGNERHSL